MSFLRPFFALFSLIILAAAAYLLWTWYQGELVRYPDGVVVRVREDWRLWLGVPLLAWSFIGRSAVLWLLAPPDSDPMRPQRSGGEHLPSANGASLYVEELGPADAPTGWHGISTTLSINRSLDCLASAGCACLDVWEMAKRVRADPAASGFIDVISPCSHHRRCEGHLFWDGIHPTTQAHRRMGEAAAELLVTL